MVAFVPSPSVSEPVPMRPLTETLETPELYTMSAPLFVLPVPTDKTSLLPLMAT